MIIEIILLLKRQKIHLRGAPSKCLFKTDYAKLVNVPEQNVVMVICNVPVRCPDSHLGKFLGVSNANVLRYSFAMMSPAVGAIVFGSGV